MPDNYTQTQPKTNEKECKWCGCFVKTDVELCPDCESDEFFESVYIQES